MQAENNHKYPKIQELIKILYNEKDKRKSLDIGLELANAVLSVFGANENNFLYGDDALDKAFSNAKFKNQKMETWFKKHPYFKSGRVAINLYEDSDAVYESNFYWLNESATKARVSSTVMLNPNWEDSELTMLPSYKIGIDFFLNNTADSLSIVISKNGNLRVLELSEKLSNTQVEIFDNVRNCLLIDGIDPKTGKIPEKEPQQTIHRKLWDAFELKEVNKKFYIGIADHFERLCQYLEKDPIIQEVQCINKKRVQNFSNRLIGRLLFLWFLRKRNIIDESQKYFVINSQNSSEYYESKLKPLFFDTLNKSVENRTTSDKKTPYLNGGLFEAHEDDFVDVEISFPEDWFYTLYSHLDGFNFTTDESTSEYQQVAIDPEMLGRVFENLLASIRPETSGTANERKNKGAFYTPREIVDYICKESLKNYIKNVINNEKDYFGIDRLFDLTDSDFMEQKSTGISELWGNRSTAIKEKIISILNNLKVLDPACGSGAFPIGMMQLIVKTYDRLSAIYDDQIVGHRIAKSNEKINLYSTKLAIIQNNLYGVDIEPMAVEISRLRAWLSLIIDETSQVKPLPNLDFNFVCANSLIPLVSNSQVSLFNDIDYEEKLNAIRMKFFNAHDMSIKSKLKNEFNELYSNEYSEGKENDDYVKQLKSWNPFDLSQPSSFFDAKKMFDLDKFNLVIGNPPYIGESGNKEIFREIKNTSFGKKYYLGKMDYFYFFMHLGIDLLEENGVLGFITTNYFSTADGARILRKEIYGKTQIIKLINFNELTIFESAKGQHDMITILKKDSSNINYSSSQMFVNDKISISNFDLKELLRGKFDSINYVSIYKNDLFYGVESKDYFIRFASASVDMNAIIMKISANNKLSKFANINQGVVPNKLDIFVSTKENFDQYKIPKIIRKKYFKNSDIDRWKTKTNSFKEILYIDHNTTPDKRTIEYLHNYKEFLENRRECKNGRKNWYELHWAREQSIFEGEKIVVPYRSKINTFAYNNIPWYASTDVYFITPKSSKYSLLYILGILNSKLIYCWLYYSGKKKGNILELFPTPLKNIPIKIADKNSITKMENLVGKIIFSDVFDSQETINIENKINNLVYDVYELNEQEVEVIERSYKELTSK